MSYSLLPFFTKERYELIALVALLKRAMWEIHSWFERIACKKQANRLQKSLKKVVFFICFWLFSPFLCPQANGSHHSSQKSDIERFAQVTHDKRATRVIHFFSFTKNKQIDQKTDERIPNPGKLQFFKILGNNYTVCYKTSLQNSMKLTTMFYSTTVCTV